VGVGFVVSLLNKTKRKLYDLEKRRHLGGKKRITLYHVGGDDVGPKNQRVGLFGI